MTLLSDEAQRDFAWLDRFLRAAEYPETADRIQTYLGRSHEPPRNSGEGTAVNGPMPLAGGDDANAPT